MPASTSYLHRALIDLSRHATTGFEGDASVAASQAIIAGAIGADVVSIVYATVADGFCALDPTAVDDLSQHALWFVNRDVTTAAGPRGFRVNRGRVGDHVDATRRQSFDRVAIAIPLQNSSGQLLVGRGRWRRGLPANAAGFLSAAMPATGLLLQRWLRIAEAKRDRDQLTALFDITRGLSGADDLEQWLRSLAHTVATVADVAYVTIDLLDPAGDVRMRCVNYDMPESDGQTDRWLHAARRPDPIRKEVVRSRRPALFPDAQQDERLPAQARSFCARMLVRSTGVFPLAVGDEVLGVLSVASTRQLEFGSAEVALIESMAAQASTAVKGIELYRELAESRATLAQKSELLEHALEAERDHARRDSLTGVLNHGAIAEKLKCLAEESSHIVPFAVAMVDVDGMKATNDTYGHPVGDALLRRLAATLQSERAIVGRYGGDEFLVALPGADRAAAEAYRNEVLARMATEHVVDPESGTQIPLVASIGLAVYPDEAAAIDDLIKLADSAMYGLRRERRSAPRNENQPLLQGERAARLVGEIVPLLTAPGTREEKLALVAHRLSVGAGYDAVNFEVAGERPADPGDWERTFVRAPQQSVDAWVRAQSSQADDHPLSRAMRKSQRPIFVDRLADTKLLTPPELEVLAQTGLQSALVVPMIWHNQLVGMLSVASKRERAFTTLDAHFLTAVSSQVTAIVFMTTLVEELQLASADITAAHSETVMLLAAAAEAHDQTTGRHLHRVRSLSEALARELGYSEAQADDIGIAAVLHDIGKIRVPDAVLRSPNALSPEEWRIMKQHSMWGSDFLDGRRGFQLASLVARCHHERWDGGGYPQGLRGDEIPEAAAITSVADCFDAITNDRPYRQGRPASAAVAEIANCSGTQFSPRVVDALRRICERGELMFDEDDSEALAA